MSKLHDNADQGARRVCALRALVSESSVLTCGYNSKVGTKQGQIQLISQHFCSPMRILAELAQTNMKFALDRD